MDIAKAAARPTRRSDAGHVPLTARDITGLLLLAEHYDLLADALDAPPARLRAIVARWRTAGLAASGSFGPGPAWCWLTPAGMTATGWHYRAHQPHCPGSPTAQASQAEQSVESGQSQERPFKKLDITPILLQDSPRTATASAAARW